MTVVEALLTNGAYGYPRGSARRHTPHILAVVHQTATAPYDGQAMALRNQRNGSGWTGNTATYYIDPDGDAVHAVDGDRYASWCSAPANISYLDTTRTSIATVLAHFKAGYNPNECVVEQFECVGTGIEPWTDAQFETAARLIAARATVAGLPITRETVVPHRDFDKINRPSDPWPAATREARMAHLISRANAILAEAHTATGNIGVDTSMRSFSLSSIGGAHLVGAGHYCIPLDGSPNDGPWPDGTNWMVFGEATLAAPLDAGAGDRKSILLVIPMTRHDGTPWTAAKPAALLRMDTDWPAHKTVAPAPDCTAAVAAAVATQKATDDAALAAYKASEADRGQAAVDAAVAAIKAKAHIVPATISFE